MVERYIGIGLFGGFDLEKYRHLQYLATALEYWLGGGRDEQSTEMKRLTQLQKATIGNIAYRMVNSPLLTEIITPILHVPRNGGFNAPPELLAAGKDLMDYAIPGAWHPRAHAYQDALSAWKNRWPFQPPGNVHPRHKEMHEAAVRYNKFENEQRERSRPVPGGIESDYVSLIIPSKHPILTSSPQQTDSDEEKQPKNNKRKKKSKTKAIPRSASFSRTSSSTRQPAQSNRMAKAGRLNKKGKTTFQSEIAAEVTTSSLSPLSSNPLPPGGRSAATEVSSTYLPPLISNRPPPPTCQSSTTTGTSSTYRVPKVSNEPFSPTHPAIAKASTTSLAPNTFEQPLLSQSRRSSRLSQVINYRDLSPEPEALHAPAPTTAVTEEEEKWIRQDRRLAIVMTYDLPRDDLPDGWNPGNMSLPPHSLADESEGHTSQVAEDISQDPARFAPRKPRGGKAIDDGTIDFSSAVIGTQDDSKLSLDFNTIRPDPKNPSNSIPGERVTNRYHLTVDFNDKNSVRKLNIWRKQIIGRNFPDKKSKTVQSWLQNEKQLVLDLMREQMEHHGYIKWNRLTNTYNRRMAGVTQRAGEELVAQGNRKAGVLKEDREAPWRTKSALAGVKDRWQEFKDMVEASLPSVGEDENGEIEERETVYSSDDEEEILEPGSGSSA
ncbi:hypothetical protein N431DRAFT_510896 [Stipitochalara longipes BDJ]|nr:hypothetical protein N431DRAFT_510896 [Stipitochalara longipes BDJ]